MEIKNNFKIACMEKIYIRDMLGVKYKISDEKSKQNFDFLIKKMEGFLGVVSEKEKNIKSFLSQDDKNLIEFQILSLFSFLELIFSIFIIYENNKIKTKDKLFKFTKSKDYNYKKELVKFINKYILNEKNKYYIENKNTLKRWNAKKLLDLRNHLSHCLAVPAWVVLANEKGKKEVFKIGILEKNGEMVIITPDIFLKVISESFNILRDEILKSYFSEDKKNRKVVRKKLKRISEILVSSTSKLILFDKK